MKRLIKVAAALFIGWQMAGAPLAVAQGTKDPKATGPRIKFSETAFNFGRARASDVLRHDFIVTNSGDAPLEISEVKPACGCTLAGTWTRWIQPGQTGKIPIEFRPVGFTGTISKSIAVTSNDPAQPTHTLQIEATIWQPIELQPANLYFTPVEGEPVNETKVVRITSNLGQALTLEPPQSTSPAIQLRLKTVETGKRFELHVTHAVLTASAPLQSAITIKTSSNEHPVIKLSATVMPQPAVAAIPAQITLPAEPSKDVHVHGQIVVNNSSTPIKVTEAGVNAEGVTVEITEPKHGKLFMLKVSFPARFQVPPGRPLELSIRTSHPMYSVITVPIDPPASSPILVPTSHPHAK